MPDEPNPFDLFRSPDATPTFGAGTAPLDSQAIIRRARRRRLPRQIATGVLGTLAVAGIGVAGITGLTGIAGGAGGASSASDSSVAAESAPDVSPYSADNDDVSFSDTESSDQAPPSDTSGSLYGEFQRAPAERINLCGGTLAEVAPNESGLELTAEFGDAAVGASTVDGTVTLTNTGSSPVTGYTAATAAITLSQDNVVLWHSNGPSILSITDVDLGPGESLSYPASFSPVICSVDDDLADSFPTDLPAAPAGQYQVGAAIDLTTAGSTELITGPTSTVTLR